MRGGTGALAPPSSLRPSFYHSTFHSPRDKIRVLLRCRGTKLIGLSLPSLPCPVSLLVSSTQTIGVIYNDIVIAGRDGGMGRDGRPGVGAGRTQASTVHRRCRQPINSSSLFHVASFEAIELFGRNSELEKNRTNWKKKNY